MMTCRMPHGSKVWSLSIFLLVQLLLPTWMPEEKILPAIGVGDFDLLFGLLRETYMSFGLTAQAKAKDAI